VINGESQPGLRWVNCEAVNSSGGTPETGAHAEHGLRSAVIVLLQGATTGASSGYVTVVATKKPDEKTGKMG